MNRQDIRAFGKEDPWPTAVLAAASTILTRATQGRAWPDTGGEL